MTYPPWFQNTLSEFDAGKVQAQAAKDAGVKLFLWSTLPHIGDYEGLGGVEVFDRTSSINSWSSYNSTIFLQRKRKSTTSSSLLGCLQSSSRFARSSNP